MNKGFNPEYKPAPKKKHRFRRLLLIVIIAIAVISFFKSDSILKNEIIDVVSRVPVIGNLVGDISGEDEWDELVLENKLPEEHYPIDVVWDNSKNYMKIDLDMSVKEYYAYIEKCREFGYSVNEYEEEWEYHAYDQSGFRIVMEYRDYADSLLLEVFSPIELGTYTWPQNVLVDSIPAPDSETGKIFTDADKTFVAIIGEYTVDDYEAYVDACIEAGYDTEKRDADIHDDYFDYSTNKGYCCTRRFIGSNADGYRVVVDYTGVNNMKITVSIPQDENAEETAEPEPSPIASSEGNAEEIAEPEPTVIANGARDGDGSDDIKNIQERLSELGYLSGAADGVFGSGTEKALKEFQKNNGLDATGVADEETLEVLESSDAVPKVIDDNSDNVNTGEALVDGMRPSVKAAIDSYEQYFIDLVAFMENYSANPNDLTLLTDYLEFMGSYLTMLDEFESMEEDLNDKELIYYIAAQGRITQMLLTIDLD